MYYDSYKRKPVRPRRRRRSFGNWLAGALLKLLAFVLVLALIAAAALFALPPSIFEVEPEGVELSLTDGLPGSMIHVLLLGMDVNRDSMQRSDAILIASIGYGKLRITSLLRDTYVDIPGHGKGKLNAAFAYGGPELAMRTINQNFGLNIMYYAAADYVAVVRAVDAMGGVEIDISEGELGRLNPSVLEMKSVFAPLGYVATELKNFGENTHLNGLQALAYARIRSLDSDYMRASRQRTLLNAMLKKLRATAWNPVMWVRLAQAVFASVDTNMSVPQIISLGEKAVLAGGFEQLRLPADGSFTDDGSKLILNDKNASREAFLRFAYGD